MDASFFPRMQAQGGKQKEHGHSLLFDSAMSDKVLRLNAYEERVLLKRTEHIEKQKQQALEEHNFCKSRFLLRFLPVVKRQSELRKELLSKAFESFGPNSEKSSVERNRPLSSYTDVKSRNGSAYEQPGIKPIPRRTVSAELRFPALQEHMDDILNGYRTGKTQPKSVSPTKMRFRGKLDLELQKNNSQARREPCPAKRLTPRTKTRSKAVDFDISMDKSRENTERENNALCVLYPKISQSKETERVATVSVDENSSKHGVNFVNEADNDMNIEQETGTEAAVKKLPSKASVKILKRDSGVASDENSNSFPTQLKIFQNGSKLPEKLLKDLINTLRNDTTASNTAHFLARMLNNDKNSSFPYEQENHGSLVSLQLESSNEFHLLSDVKKRQRHEAQRLRIMRTVVLAYDSVWHERVKRISTAA